MRDLLPSQFLLERIEEDEERAEHDRDHFGGSSDPRDRWIVRYADRLAGECKTKRTLVEHHIALRDSQPDPGHERAKAVAVHQTAVMIEAMIQVYADHPDFDPAWRDGPPATTTGSTRL